MKPVWVDIEQGTEAWRELRKGRITASIIKSIMGKQGIGKMADTLAKRIAWESLGGEAPELLETYYIQRGIELEPVARARYEDITGNTVKDGGFFCLGEDQGVSPDGLVGTDGLVEFKCPKWSTHADVLKSQTYDPQYYFQMQYQLLVSGRKWVDFGSFCDEYKNKKKQMFITRLKPNNVTHQLIEQRVNIFQGVVEDWKIILK